MVPSGLNVLLQGVNGQRLLLGLWQGIRIALVSVIIGVVVGVLLGMLRLNGPRVVQVILRVYLEFFRIIPILVWLYFFYYFLPSNFGIELSSDNVAVLVFSLWVAAEMSDLVRGALASLPKHQVESGLSLGLSWAQLYGHVLLPQAVKRLLPSTLNLVTRVIKTSSLLMMIGVIEVISVGKQIIEVNNNKVPTTAFWVYGVIFFLYFSLCLPLSKLSQKLEQKWKVEEGAL